MKRYIILLALSVLAGSVFAQGAEDALRYSQTYYMGTARSMAMGGAFGALGADLSVAATNPAGLGLYRLSEYSISPYFTNSIANSKYNGTNQNSYKLNVGLSNVGYVSAIKLNSDRSGGWKYVQFAAGMNKLNDFHSYIDMHGPNANNSRLDVYLTNADGINYNDIANNTNNNYSFYLQPAWDLYLIDTIPGYSNYYYSPVPFGGAYQRDQHYRSGAVNQWFVSAAANFNNFVYIGATLGFNSLRYSDDSYYTESDVADTIPYFNSWELDQSLETTGSGINLKVGIIVQPVNWLRIGAAIHTPTWYYNMTDTWQTTTYADLGWISPSSVTSPVGTFNYSLTTPMKFLGDVGIIVGKRGSISAEWERVNYATMKFYSPDYSFSTENENIKQYYQSTNNFRLGTEWRFGVMDLRAGYAYYGSPYAQSANDGKRVSVSGGLGLHMGHYNFDLAYIHSVQKQNYYFYGNSSVGVNPSSNTYNKNSVVLSVSYRFF